jgi:hypothetical protein
MVGATRRGRKKNADDAKSSSSESSETTRSVTMMSIHYLFLAAVAVILLPCSNAFTTPLDSLPIRLSSATHACQYADNNSKRHSTVLQASRFCRAQELMTSLIEEDQCYTTESGAKAFGAVCDRNVVYEDRYEPFPIVGKLAVTNHMLEKVAQRKGKGGFRLDRISDGDKACGFAWTWTCGDEEGLRGTTYVELNDSGNIQYVREIPEPIYKPGDLILDLLKGLTKDAEPTPPKEFEQKTPTIANEVAKYLFLEVQGSSVDEALRFFDDNIRYRDFNYEEILKGTDQVRKFVADFSFPGITFRPQRFDDGKDSCCFTWEITLMDAPDTIKGISFYELDPETRKVAYVRDIPESAIKPPLLGKLARQLRPGLGVFQGVKLGSRPGGM